MSACMKLAISYAGWVDKHINWDVSFECFPYLLESGFPGAVITTMEAKNRVDLCDLREEDYPDITAALGAPLKD